MSGPALSVEGLTMHYSSRAGDVKAVDDVSFALERGQVLGLVGESGCGKTSVGISLMKLLPDNARVLGGRVLLDGVDLLELSEEEIRPYRWKRISMVFQAAMNSLNPVHRVADQVAEAIETHERLSRAETDIRVTELFEMVGLDPDLKRSFPHQLSGGMKQRAVIAMAMACKPDVVIADEPTTALDVIVQDTVLQEIRKVQKSVGMSMIYISHDIGVVAEIADVTGVMYAGRLVEMGDTAEVFRRPIHPYTAALTAAHLRATGEKQELVAIQGEPPDLIEPPKGCRFHPRCPAATEVCGREEPPVVSRNGHWARCWNPLP